MDDHTSPRRTTPRATQSVEPPARLLDDGHVPGRRRRRSGQGAAAGGGGTARSRAVGAYGERMAVRHLEAAGLVVVDRNWRCELGELDIVAVQRSRLRPVLVACEVKTRTSTRFGDPTGQISAVKAERLRRLARRWLEEHPEVRGPVIRIDVVGVLVPSAGPPQVRHLVGVSS